MDIHSSTQPKAHPAQLGALTETKVLFSKEAASKLADQNSSDSNLDSQRQPFGAIDTNSPTPKQLSRKSSRSISTVQGDLKQTVSPHKYSNSNASKNAVNDENCGVSALHGKQLFPSGKQSTNQSYEAKKVVAKSEAQTTTNLNNSHDASLQQVDSNITSSHPPVRQ